MTGEFHSVETQCRLAHHAIQVVWDDMRRLDLGDMSYGERVVHTRASGVVVLLSVTKACAMMRLTDPLKPAMDAKTTSLVDKSLNHQDI